MAFVTKASQDCQGTRGALISWGHSPRLLTSPGRLGADKAHRRSRQVLVPPGKGPATPSAPPQILGPPHQAPHALPPQHPFQVSAESMRPGVAWLGLSDLAARGQTEMGSDSFHCFICEFKIRKERNPGKQLIAKQLTSGRRDPKLQARVSSGRGARTIWSQIPAPTRPGAGKGPHLLTSSLLH